MGPSVQHKSPSSHSRFRASAVLQRAAKPFRCLGRRQLGRSRSSVQIVFKRTSSGKPVRRVRVREGGTGILYLNGSPVQERFIPNYDLENTRELLQAFQELKDSRGVSLKDNYWCQGDNWFPSMVSYLYWHAFFPYVKYKPLVDAFIDGHVEFEFDNHGAFYHLLMLVTGKRDSNAIKTAIFRSLVRLNNALAAARSNANLMFFRFESQRFQISRNSAHARRAWRKLFGGRPARSNSQSARILGEKTAILLLRRRERRELL